MRISVLIGCFYYTVHDIFSLEEEEEKNIFNLEIDYNFNNGTQI